jgi:acyl-CoA thioester hydrolase
VSEVTLTLPVLWGDMDALGHVNNLRYHRWMESARIALFERVGLVTTAPSNVGPILATASCDFLVPVRYPCSIRVATRVTKIGQTSITQTYEIRDDAKPDTLYARGTSVCVLFDYAASTKVLIPADLRQNLEALG